MESIFAEELHQSLIRSISADNLMSRIEHGLGILADGQVQKPFHLNMPGQFRNRNHLSVCREKFHYFQASLGNGTCLITEQNIQRSCRLDSFCLSYKDIVV